VTQSPMRMSAVKSRTVVTALLAVSFAATCMAGADRNGELVPAIRASDYEQVKTLLKSRAADPNRLLPDGSTPLSWAVEVQDARMVKLLLAARAKPDAATNSAAAPLMLACEHGNAEILQMLLDAGADAKRVRADGVSALVLCAGNAPAPVLARLIRGGASVDAAGASGQTPLMWAAARGRLDNLQLLLAKGADVNRVTAQGFTPLFFALKSGRPELPVAVLAAGGNPDHVGPEGTSAVQLAIFQKDYAFAARLIERGVDVKAFDRNGQTLLQAAVVENQPALVKLLLAKGADPNAWSGMSKVQWRYEPNFKSADYYAPSKPPLLVAAEKGAADVIQLLVDAGADPAVRMRDGTTVLHAAVSSDRLAAVSAALKIMPDANVVDKDGQTPLHRLLLTRHYPGAQTAEIMHLLASQHARVDIKDAKGRVAEDLLDGEPAELKAAYFAAFSVRSAAR